MHASGEDVGAWFSRLDQALYRAKDGGRNRAVVDRYGRPDLHAPSEARPLLHLVWHESYESGESTIDREHRELFAFANALIEAVTQDGQAATAVLPAFDTLLAHVQQHFSDEEAILARLNYGDLAAHRRAHAGLLERAVRLQEQARAGRGSLGDVVQFLAQDVVARHLMISDRAFFPLFEGEAMASEAPRSPQCPAAAQERHRVAVEAAESDDRRAV